MRSAPRRVRGSARDFLGGTIKGVALLLLAAVALLPARSNARLQPYYLVRGSAAGQINPRVLFALDTSGSMVWLADPTDCPYGQRNRQRQCDCLWNECEDTNDPSRASRIAGAREAIRRVVGATEGAADFGLMTFGSVAPPSSRSEVPDPCSGGRRFAWVQEATGYAGGQTAYGPWGDQPPPGRSSPRAGTWALCGENRPFPYVRADETGLTVPSDFDPEDPPPGPLFAAWGTWSQWRASSMEYRRVQWLPSFMGTHFNLPCAEVTADSPVDRAVGDYGRTEMCGHDFFYVPYVDGFTGYPAMTGYSSRGNVRMGVHERAFNIRGSVDVCVQWNDPCCEDYCQDNTDFQNCTEDCDTVGTPPAPGPEPQCDYYVGASGRTRGPRGDGTRLRCNPHNSGADYYCECGINSVDISFPIDVTEEDICDDQIMPCTLECEAHCRSSSTVDGGTCYDCIEDGCMETCINSNCLAGTGLAGTAPLGTQCQNTSTTCDYYRDGSGTPVPVDGGAVSCSSAWDAFAGVFNCYCSSGGTSIDTFTSPTDSCAGATCIQTCEANCAAGCFTGGPEDRDCFDDGCVAQCASSYCTGGGLTGVNPGHATCDPGTASEPCPSANGGCSQSSSCDPGGCTQTCECTVAGDTFDCSSDVSCWDGCVASCESTCGAWDALGCAKRCWDTTCSPAPDCQETCEDRTEDCLDTCSGSNSCPVCEEWESRSSVGNASLLAPFWSQGAIDRFAGLDEGPASAADAHNTVLGLTSHAMYGGVGAQSGTPWSTAIGDIPYLPGQPLPPGVSNAPYSHNSVASYLALMSHPDLGGASACAPLSLVVITDGEPSPSREGGTRLYDRLSSLRTDLGVKVYVVGFTLDSSELNDMACAAAGGGDSRPCRSNPVGEFDTCRDPMNPRTDCAFLAENPDELAEVLRVIMVEQTSTDVPAGLGASVNEFLSATDPSERQSVQTAVEGFTTMPDFEGHVLRVTCDQSDFPDLSAAEVAQICSTTEPLAIEDDEAETFSTCSGTHCRCNGFSRTWDAGECLQDTPWESRRLYTYVGSGAGRRVVRLISPSGAITPAFDSLLQGSSAVGLGLPDLQDAGERQAFAAFLAGEHWPDGWKLGGLGKSTPVVARRIPARDPQFIPSVGVRDPHCAGRILGESADVPLSLQEFSDGAWGATSVVGPGGGYAQHRDYQEAVLVGTDIGFLHAFQLDSGNELFAFMPPFLLANAYRMFQNGPENRGQPSALADHESGISATVNHGWVFDGSADTWRHLAVVGMGAGGKEYLALDLSHMGRLQTDDPIEVLWTTEDVALKPDYEALLGETWSRPALTYSFPGVDPLSPSAEPTSHVVFASGYPDDTPAGAGQGRTIVLADALTGVIEEQVRVPVPSDPTLQYEVDSAVVNDIAVSSHCLNGLWAEMQEAYFADPMGGLYRWDLGLEGSSRDHAADSGRTWSTNVADGSATAVPVFRFRACQGTGDTCTVDTTGGKFDSFTYGPAVAATGRFSEIAQDQTETDQFVLAMVSGAPDDDALDAGLSGSDFHSSLYILVDDHRGPIEHGGFSIPGGGDRTGGVTDASFFRVALSDITRTRTFTPYGGATPVTDVGTFGRGTRPIRPPRILMQPVDGRPDLSVLYFEFVVYEPGSRTCDPRFFDGADWHADPGSTHRILFRLTVNAVDGFNLVAGSGAGFTEADPYAPGVSGPGLSMADVQQMDGGDCAGGGCGVNPGSTFTPPCDENAYTGAAGSGYAITLSYAELAGFTPVEG